MLASRAPTDLMGGCRQDNLDRGRLRCHVCYADPEQSFCGAIRSTACVEHGKVSADSLSRLKGRAIPT
jgi:hypothetical protein